MTASLAPPDVLPLLRGRFGRPYRFVAECASTQDLVREEGLPEGAVAVADHQTAGRGRAGRAWTDAPGRALLVSVLLRPPRAPELAQLSLVAGHATAEAIAELTGLATHVKWPNDVLLDGSKVAGILLESTGDAVITGIGVNVSQSGDELPPGTSPPAGSLLTATGRHLDRAALVAELLARLEHAYERWRDAGLAPLLPALEERNWLRGRQVVAHGAPGVAGAMAPDGALVVDLDRGGTLLAVSGEVTLVPES